MRRGKISNMNRNQTSNWKIISICLIFMSIIFVWKIVSVEQLSNVEKLKMPMRKVLRTPMVSIDELDKLIREETKQIERKRKNASRSAELFFETFSLIKQRFSNFYQQNETDRLCSEIPSNLRGPSPVEFAPPGFSLFQRSQFHPEVQLGGAFRPLTCKSRHKIAIIVPYRDRLKILENFLFHTHKILQRQDLDYRFYVCEQAFDKTFNKGVVMNACFKEILRLQPDTQCFIMHDVDLLLVDDRNMYSCPIYPRHLSVSIDKFDFYLPYTSLVGGVLAMSKDDYLLVNGYSTSYWGWGGEDDDMYARIVKKNLVLIRPPNSIARYKMMKHSHQKLNPVRMKILRTAHIRVDTDGVNNVEYKLINTTLFHLFTHFLIDVGEAPI